MLAVSGLIQHYLGIPYERFTGKIIASLAVMQVADYKIEGTNEFDKFCAKAKARLEFIEDNTHEDVMVSIYKLDRVINPTKGEFEPKKGETEFIRSDAETREQMDKSKFVRLDDLQIQYYLCKAIREVNDIIARIARYYSEEMKIPIFEDSNTGLAMDIK